ncbi:hypothetical protein E1180_13195 [Roseibium denhamense]|uniref:Uncharacterized protein n=1 Tax=Roseibium denhamense TaxID=76305 RepID=A0ABY1NJS8_9HYPH|nr:DUF6505 family protein [Roseibium denhamense]MTI06474.1 hypothetical protein [Roseibium denhamense]SMP09450.1 hypothetical protein SAMN06265374_1104 [Roseibium denhamense]
MNLARAIHLDDSDKNVYFSPARTGEWCLSGGFEFSDWTDADLSGKAKQAFSNGWLGLETFGRVTLVAVTPISEAEFSSLVDRLAQHFVDVYGAPSVDAARGVAAEELSYMADLCADHAENTILAVQRELAGEGVRESYSAIAPQAAELDLVAVHGDMN